MHNFVLQKRSEFGHCILWCLGTRTIPYCTFLSFSLMSSLPIQASFTLSHRIAWLSQPLWLTLWTDWIMKHLVIKQVCWVCLSQFHLKVGWTCSSNLAYNKFISADVDIIPYRSSQQACVDHWSVSKTLIASAPVTEAAIFWEFIKISNRRFHPHDSVWMCRWQPLGKTASVMLFYMKIVRRAGWPTDPKWRGEIEHAFKPGSHWSISWSDHCNASYLVLLMQSCV